MTTVVNMYISC